MGIFSDWAEKYYDSGIYTIPCNGEKAPVILDWSNYCDTPPSLEEIEGWVKKYKNLNQIGLPMGQANGIVAFDFDYAYDPKKTELTEEEFKKDKDRVEKEILELLPQSYCGKVGKKGWTRFYKWNPNLTNKKTNRNGIRLFDFLSSGCQTIIPPSIHSVFEDKKIYYHWIDEPLDEIKSLPELSMEVIDTIFCLYSDNPKKLRPNIKDMSRHERVMYFILDALRVDINLERVAKGAIDYDTRVNGKTPYLTDPKYYDSKDVFKNSMSFVEKINKWAIRREALRSKDEKKSKDPITETSWNHFFEIAFPETRKDIFSHKISIRKDPNAPWEIMAEHDGVLRSYARKHGLPATHVVDEFDRWSFEKKELQFLCDIPDWDGVDRIAHIAGSISSDRFSQDQIIEIFKHWGVHVFRRVYDSTIQNRCIILKGLQGAGKDTVVRALLNEFKPYYEATTLPGTPKDVLEIVSRLLVVHIEEFDQTKHLDVGFLKSLITQPTSFFRESYGHSPNSKIMRPSFITTANVDDIFRDPTGNRRFILIPVSDVKWDYPKNESKQVIAQWKTLFDQGKHFVLSDETEAVIKTIINEYTPDSLEDSIIEVYKSKFDALTGVHGSYANKDCLTGVQMTEALCAIAKTMNCSLRRVQVAIKSKGFTVRNSAGILYFRTVNDACSWRAGLK